MAYVFFSGSVQGKDIILTGLKSRQTGLFFIVGLAFWVLITWYTSRLIAYNHDRLFQVAKNGLYHAPRILGYACFTITITCLAVLIPSAQNALIQIVIFLSSAIGYAVLHPLFEKIKNNSNRKLLILYRNGLWLLFAIIIGTMVLLNTSLAYICLLPFLQAGYLFLVITRRKISETSVKHYAIPTQKHLLSTRLAYRDLVVWIFTDKEGKRDPLKKELMIQTEKKHLSLVLHLFFHRYNHIFFCGLFHFIFPLHHSTSHHTALLWHPAGGGKHHHFVFTQTKDEFPFSDTGPDPHRRAFQ